MNKIHYIDTLLNKLFVELGYECSDFSFVNHDDDVLKSSLFAKNIFKNNYYLLIFLSNTKQLEEVINNQAHYFYLLKEFFNEDPDIDKNTSMVISFKTEQIPRKLILTLEEDPYYFKKYVLTYSQEQVTNFIEENSNYIESNGIKNTFDKVISDEEKFRKFKLTPNVLTTYNFISNIFVKIPILRMNIDEDKEIYSLRGDIDLSLKNKGLLDLKILLDSYQEKEINDETLLEDLIKFYDEKE